MNLLDKDQKLFLPRVRPVTRVIVDKDLQPFPSYEGLLKPGHQAHFFSLSQAQQRPTAVFPNAAGGYLHVSPTSKNTWNVDYQPKGKSEESLRMAMLLGTAPLGTPLAPNATSFYPPHDGDQYPSRPSVPVFVRNNISTWTRAHAKANNTAILLGVDLQHEANLRKAQASRSNLIPKRVPTPAQVLSEPEFDWDQFSDSEQEANQAREPTTAEPTPQAVDVQEIEA